MDRYRYDTNPAPPIGMILEDYSFFKPALSEMGRPGVKYAG